MKKITLAFIIIGLWLSACQHSANKTSQLLSAKNLPLQVYTVTCNTDTTLHTINGAIIHIAAGTLAVDNGTTAQLEIREAYSMEQIILAGLTTQSNGQPLSSAGMIYINAVAGPRVSIKKPINVKIPTPSLNKNMQRFKGEETPDGKINWVKPDSLPANPQLVKFEIGKALFNNSCASCHNIGKDGTGPDLAYALTKAPDKKLLYAFTLNNKKVLAQGNPYYNCLYCSRGKTAMNLFPGLTDTDLDNLYGYIENTSRVRNLPIDTSFKACVDSMMLYIKLRDTLIAQRDKLSLQKVEMLTEKIIAPVPSADTTGPLRKVIPNNTQSLYYQFNVEAFGWYNIDILLKDANSVKSSLMIRIQGEFKTDFNLFLVIPSAKVYEQGGLLQGKTDEYGFYDMDGSTWMPQSLKAYIMAVGETDGKLIFAKKEFTTSTNMQFDMRLAVTDTISFREAVASMDISNMHISVGKTVVADSLRSVIKKLADIEILKPRTCICDCLSDTTSRPFEYYIRK